MIYKIIFFVLLASNAFAQMDDKPWPRTFSADAKTFSVYQPQIEKWNEPTIEGRAAISIETVANSAPTYGVIWFKSRTKVDKNDITSLQDIKISKLSFPSEPDKNDEYKELIQKNIAPVLGKISADLLRSSLAIQENESKRKIEPLKNEPPKFIYSESPSSLVLIDGPAVLRDTSSTDLMRVANSRALIVFNKADSQYYLDQGKNWYQASKLDGEWAPSTAAPELVTKLENIKKAQPKNNSAPETASEGITAPVVDKPADEKLRVFSSTTPAELIQTKGKPQMEPIAGTQLLYVSNTTDSVFLDTTDQKYYVNYSGRWFQSKALDGSFSYVDSEKLPKDFAKIPAAHAKGDVLASVPGTPAAKQAAIANEIPQAATISREQARIDVNYDGEPQFVPVTGTDMQYAKNTATPIIHSGSNYWAVENGVWFTSPAPRGPWVVATSVPKEIYSIPPTSPVYPVTYVYVYRSTPQYVYVGYTPGYMGSYVTPSGMVVYGTGYYYEPWVGNVWYGYPYTYGFGFGWGWGFGWGYRSAYYGPWYHPWWGPWPHYGYGGYPYWGGRPYAVNRFNYYNNWGHGVVQPVLKNNSSPLNARNYTSPRGNSYMNGNRGTAFRGMPGQPGQPNGYYRGKSRSKGRGW